MKLSVHHEITVDFGAVTRAQLHLLLTPFNTPQQKIERWSVTMPGIDAAASFRDGAGNKAQLVTLLKPEGPIDIVVDGMVETFDKAGVLGRLELDPAHAIFRRPSAGQKVDPALVAGLKAEGGVAVMHELMARVRESAASQRQSQNGQSQSQGETADDAAGRFVGAARELGYPARHVTGYVHNDARGHFHDWAEVWEQGLGWVGFDPALDLCPADTHVRLACGLDVADAAPIRTVPVMLSRSESVAVASV